MMATYQNDLVLRAARGERTPRTPAWLMRQAGRTDPEYVALKKEAGLTLEALFRHPELASRISLLPLKLNIDAIIFFQDILTPLAPMGCEFVFRLGPVTENPVASEADVAALREYDVADELPFVAETFRLALNELDGEMPVLGFAGAPLTLAVFMVEGKSFGDSAQAAMAFLRQHPDTAHRLLEKLTGLTIDYLRYQIEAGAAAVQLFESAAHLLTAEMYTEFALPYQQRIFEALKGSAPTIMFAREWGDVRDLDASGADVLSLPSSISIADARAIVGANRVVQGNVDNALLVHGSAEEIESAARECVESGNHSGHIFNLSHGLLRETPFDNIVRLIDTVRDA